VRLGGRAILLMGPSGAGKSTLAAMLMRGGAEVLADDGVLIRPGSRGPEAVPSYPGLRLFADAAGAAGFDPSAARDVAGYTAKRRYAAGSGTADTWPLGPIYALNPSPGSFAIDRLSPRDAALELLRYAFRAELSDRTGLGEEFERVVRWSRRVELWRVTHPRRLEEAGQLADAVLAHARLRPLTAAPSES
jgi:hypothetical protein